MNRLYMAETTMTPMVGKADHRLPLRYVEVEALAREVAAALLLPGFPAVPTGPHARWVAAVAHDLRAHPGASIVIAGAEQPAAVHALAHSLNATLGNMGKTVFYIEPLQSQPTDTLASMRELMTEIDGGNANVLLILGGNPVYDAPADF